MLSRSTFHNVSLFLLEFILILFMLSYWNCSYNCLSDWRAPNFGVSDGAVTSYCLLQLNGGIITIATFTLMMQCSQKAPADIQTTHYTVLSTFEVFGKLTFSSVIGLVADLVDYPPVFLIFILLSVAVLPWFRRCPQPLRTVVRQTWMYRQC